MIYKLLALFLIIVAQNTPTKAWSMGSQNGLNLADLNYELVRTSEAPGLEPIKSYKLSFPKTTKSFFGMVAMINMDGNFSEVLVWVSEDGKILTTDKKQENTFGFSGGYGEKFDLLLTYTKDETSEPIAKCEIIPYPLIAKDENGHSIEIQAITNNGEHFVIIGSGFIPKEKITFKSKSCDESMSHPFIVDNSGSFTMTYSPATIGKTEGLFEVTFIGLHMKPLKIQHFWGKIAFTYPNEYKKLKAKYGLSE